MNFEHQMMVNKVVYFKVISIQRTGVDCLMFESNFHKGLPVRRFYIKRRNQFFCLGLFLLAHFSVNNNFLNNLNV